MINDNLFLYYILKYSLTIYNIQYEQIINSSLSVLRNSFISQFKE